jgi:hypothetical protein
LPVPYSLLSSSRHYPSTSFPSPGPIHAFNCLLPSPLIRVLPISFISILDALDPCCCPFANTLQPLAARSANQARSAVVIPLDLSACTAPQFLILPCHPRRRITLRAFAPLLLPSQNILNDWSLSWSRFSACAATCLRFLDCNGSLISHLCPDRSVSASCSLPVEHRRGSSSPS